MTSPAFIFRVLRTFVPPVLRSKPATEGGWRNNSRIGLLLLACLLLTGCAALNPNNHNNVFASSK